MKTARWCGIICLSFFLWLLLFPPWVETLSYGNGVRMNRLGQHWLFSVFPLHGWWRAQIDYQLMLYEAVIAFVALALLFLLVPALEMPFRRVTTCAKVETILMRTRIRNWLRRVPRLPTNATVLLCAAYLLAAAFLAIRVPAPPPEIQGVPPGLTEEPVHQSAPGLAPWEEAAQEASQKAAQQQNQSRSTLAPWEEAAQEQRGSRMKLLQEAALFLLTAAVYVGLSILFRWRRRAQES
jgi:predicted PurR-regulated permease PerM